LTESTIKESQERDVNCSDLIKHCELNNNKSKNGEYELINGKLFKIDKCKKLLVAPKDFREKILEKYHDHALVAHLSRDKLLKLLKDRFYWPGMYMYVKNWTKSCDTCSRIKTPAPIRNGTLQPIRITRAFQLVGIDIIILRTSKSGNKYALACIDYLTNWVEVSAMKNMTAAEVIKTFSN
jgi:hypothetical protein